VALWISPPPLTGGAFPEALPMLFLWSLWGPEYAP